MLASGTAAYAFWSATATGNATVPTATAVALTVTAGAAPDAFFPGRTVSLPITVANPNGYGVTLTRLTAVTATSSDPTSCPSANVTASTTVGPSLGSPGYLLPSPITVGAGASTTATLANVVTMQSSAPDGCQGKTFTVTLSFTGSQV